MFKIIRQFVKQLRIKRFHQIHPSAYLAWDVKVWNRDNLVMEEFCRLKEGAMIMNVNAPFVMKKWSGAAFGLTVITGRHLQIPGLRSFDIDSELKLQLDPERKSDQAVVVDEEVAIGANVTLLSGVHIGRGALVGAGAVVAKDVKPYAVVVGNPARQIGYRFRLEDIFIHEEKLYADSDRLPTELLESQYMEFEKNRKK